MSDIIVSKPPMNSLFQSEKCNVGNGSVIIDLLTCDVKINPTLSIDNAARLAAKEIYQVMQHDQPISEEPEWLNSVTFAADGYPKFTIKVVDNKLYLNSPPFNKVKRNITFWKKFTDYWYIMVVYAMKRALVARKDRTPEEDRIIHKYANIKI
jgi:hypothetical protein